MQNRVDDDLLYEVRDGTGLVTFNRPNALNALTFEMYDRLGDICGEVRLGGAVKAIIITGAGGRAFGAGTDISLFQNFATAQ
jgi:enoyl-CoA hydratase